ncbi:MAG: large subunit ribosomal protein L5 [Candidatus Berkelbacteria bacterium Licking1014_96]|uniref:Large ribosomal subunit protein uL5 n=1 Tax=Candidatus Berkelbacteria bacterium Licking1014_96 TaxID=2017149 RepID=A0A554LE92_9BACT|nr:MAG: large subunit ribosomal protein L5 [Candidatus Berkelbacteria bacterium Licking1014_96]
MSLKTYYQKKSVPMLKKELKIKNELDLPKLEKVIVSIGLSDARFNKDEAKERVETLEKITGQKPIGLTAKKAISNFKIRQGQVIAYMATLRGQRMYDFVDKLINIVLPRIRDFRGIPTYSFDKEGNLSLGIKEQLAFPEIKIEKVNKTHGLGITFVTTAHDTDEAKALIKSLGAVLSEEKKKKEEEKLETIQEAREKREVKAKEIKPEKIKVKPEKIKEED